jgi:formylglycine-generating enzyme required for sulfatase activity
MVLVCVPAGKFWMGAAASDTNADTNERPQQEVDLGPYWIDRTEITNAMYQKCIESGKCIAPGNTQSNTRASYFGNPQFNNYPVINVYWNDAKAYCAWAGRSLPTEPQWEKAARGTDGRRYPWGDTGPDTSLANFNMNEKDTTEVGKYPKGASLYGAMDMSGNVWEWVADSVQPSPSTDPSTMAHILRGGSWGSGNWYVRSSMRYRVIESRNINSGFRCSQ